MTAKQRETFQYADSIDSQDSTSEEPPCAGIQDGLNESSSIVNDVTDLSDNDVSHDVTNNGIRRSSDVTSNSSGTSGSRNSGCSKSNGGACGTPQRKRVQIVTEEYLHELPEYKLQPNMAYKVTFPYRTWDVMMQGFRNALESDTVFVCDYFLGGEVAIGVLRELALFRDGRLFERYMKRAQDCSPPYNYASLFLLEQERTHPKLDTLSVMVYKLASYYTSDWNRVSVELTYYPTGHRKQTISKQSSRQSSQMDRKVLKCVYFPNPDWKQYMANSHTQQPAGAMTILTPVRAGVRSMAVDPVFDRLVVFWGDMLDHEIAECPQECFRVILWIQR